MRSQRRSPTTSIPNLLISLIDVIGVVVYGTPGRREPIQKHDRDSAVISGELLLQFKAAHPGRRRSRIKHSGLGSPTRPKELHPNPLHSQPVWQAGCFHVSRRQVMTSIDHEGSPVSASEISATLVSLREYFENVRCGEIQRVRGRLGNLSPDQANAVDSLCHAIIEKMLHAPIAMLKSA